MRVQQGVETLRVYRLPQMQHLVHYHVLKKIPRLLHEFGVQTDRTCQLVTAAPQ